jgi:hypothetical protein
MVCAAKWSSKTNSLDVRGATFQTNSFVPLEHEQLEVFALVRRNSPLNHWSSFAGSSRPATSENANDFDRMSLSAEVAQLVEQWSEEPRSTSAREFPNKLERDTGFRPSKANSLAAT